MKKVLKNILCVIIFFIVILMNQAFATTPANIPELLDCLTPVKPDGTLITKTNGWYDYNWYDYENGIWANARLGDNGPIYVWIPRFTYKIENNEIKIKWSEGKIDDTSDGYVTHPAFYFGEYFGGSTITDEDKAANFNERNGERNELKGFWIQKELEAENLDSMADVGAAFESSIEMTKDSSNGLPPLGAYTHMTKASEWGALAYLTAAKGIVNEKSDMLYTALDNTGINISLKTSEFVAGINGNPTNIAIFSSEYKRYRDILDKDLDHYYGYALAETKNSESTQIKALDTNSFLVRGGSLKLFGYKGVKSFSSEKYGYRTAISIVSEELTEPMAFFDTETSVIEGDYLVLGIDFYVNETWKFPKTPDKFFLDDGKKVVDIEGIYEGFATWHQKDLNSQVIKLIKPDLSIDNVENITTSKTYPAGKYTLVIRVGGEYSEGDSVFLPVENMDVKIIINELNLAKSSNTSNLIKIGNIPNNKVKLNVYNKSGSTVVTSYELETAPSKVDYNLGQSLDLKNGKILSYLGKVAVAEIDTQNACVEAVNPNITSTIGRHQVELLCNGVKVDDSKVQYIIDVSNVRPLEVHAEVKLGTNSPYTLFTDEYERESSDKKEDLVTEEYLEGYMFTKWTTSLSQVPVESPNSFTTKFTVPKKSTNLSRDEVTLTASYIAPKRLEIENQKVEFLVNEDFSLGNGILTAIYQKDSSAEIRRQITLKNSGVHVTITDEDGVEQELYELQEGFYIVKIEVAGASVEYEIEVIRAKYDLIVRTDTNNGEISGTIKNAKDVIKDTITVAGDNRGVVKLVPYGRAVTLTATPKDGYTFLRWKVSTPGLISDSDLLNSKVTFAMPEKNVTIEAEFTKTYTITFRVQTGQESRGRLSGETTQILNYGESTTPVTAIANANYGFVKWLDSKGRLVSKNKELICTHVMANEEYIAVFDTVWTVTFYNGNTIFKKITVGNEGSGYINETPTKYGYIFTDWDKDLSSVTSDIITYAQFQPRINIEENLEAEINTIDAKIEGTMIKEGSLQYLISSSRNTPEDYIYNYEIDDIFTGVEGNWYKENEYYRSAKVSSGSDSSAVLTISSNNSTEIVKFNYMLSATSDSHLGITINGEKVVGPDQEISSGWNEFSREVNVVDGKIKIGLSYTQGPGNSDYAAIKNLSVMKKWIDIPNNYKLETQVQFSENYVHVRGIGSDDSVMYYAVSDVFISEGTVLDIYTVTFNADGGEGAMAIQKFTEGISKALPANEFVKDGYIFAGWATTRGEEAIYEDCALYTATENTVLYAVWKPEVPEYTITAIVHEGGTIKGVYKNYICSVCGKKNHICEVINVNIKADNSTIIER